MHMFGCMNSFKGTLFKVFVGKQRTWFYIFYCRKYFHKDTSATFVSSLVNVQTSSTAFS